MREIQYEIVKEIAVLSTGDSGYTKEINLISWNGKHICCLHICYLTEDIHKLRQICKLIKSALKTESASLYSKLQCCCHFTKVRCP